MRKFGERERQRPFNVGYQQFVQNLSPFRILAYLDAYRRILTDTRKLRSFPQWPDNTSMECINARKISDTSCGRPRIALLEADVCSTDRSVSKRETELPVPSHLRCYGGAKRWMSISRSISLVGHIHRSVSSARESSARQHASSAKSGVLPLARKPEDLRISLCRRMPFFIRPFASGRINRDSRLVFVRYAN